jgi:hypothetical protein
MLGDIFCPVRGWTLGSHLTTLGDGDLYFWLVVGSHRSILYLPHHQHTVNHFPKHHMLPILK